MGALLVLCAIICSVFAFFALTIAKGDIEIVLFVLSAGLAMMFLALARILSLLDSLARDQRHALAALDPVTRLSPLLRWLGRKKGAPAFLAAARTAGLRLDAHAGAPLLVEPSGGVTIFIDGKPGYFETRAKMEEFMAARSS